MARPYLFLVLCRGSGLTGEMSGKFIVPTSVLVDGSRDEPQTGKPACLCLVATPTTGSTFVRLCVGQFGYWFCNARNKYYSDTGLNFDKLQPNLLTT